MTPQMLAAARDPDRVSRLGRSDSDAVVVWKFGGTSVATQSLLAKAVRRAVDAHKAGRRLIVVLSAMGGTTDGLVSSAYCLSARPTARELDVLLSVGESATCAQAAMIATELGADAVSLSGAQAGIKTDGVHGNAMIREVDTTRVMDELNRGRLVFVCGFQGLTANGDITTLGRGGSDATAIALAAALGSSTCEIFTDVPAVLSADPRVVAAPQSLAALTHTEMSEIAASGGRVLQLRAAEIASTKGIAIHVRHAHEQTVGTRIQEVQVIEEPVVTAVVGRETDWLYEVSQLSLREAVHALQAHGLTPGLALRRNDVLILTAPGASPVEVRAALTSAGAQLGTSQQCGTISLVGRGLGSRADVGLKALGCLEDEGLAVLGMFSSPFRVVFITDSRAVAAGTRALHDALVTNTAVAA